MRRMHLHVVLMVLLSLAWSAVARAAVCGNGITEPGEECDDGGFCAGNFSTLIHCVADSDCPGGSCRAAGGDGCAADCTHEIQPCDSDCNRDGAVTVDEVIRGVGIALGTAPVQSCPEGDFNSDGIVTVNELITGVNQALTQWQVARVDIGGYRLRIQCIGSGSPTVVLDAGLGDDLSVWSRVQPEVASLTRVCAYTRAGLGSGRAGSDPGPLPRSSGRLVSELHTLLANSCLPPPFVLAGHSLGGGNVRLYADRYPQEVAGIVTVDGFQPDFNAGVGVRLSMDLVALLDAEWERGLAGAAKGVRDEAAALEQGAAEVRQIGAPPPVPFVVLAAAKVQPLEGATLADAAAIQAVWVDLQTALAASIPNSTLTIVPDSGHYIELERPDTVIDAIRSVVDEVHAATHD